MSAPIYVFPQDVKSDTSSTGMERYGGMELRDYFAGQFVAGGKSLDEPRREGETVPDWIARQAYTVADAMMKARLSV